MCKMGKRGKVLQEVRREGTLISNKWGWERDRES